MAMFHLAMLVYYIHVPVGDEKVIWNLVSYLVAIKHCLLESGLIGLGS